MTADNTDGTAPAGLCTDTWAHLRELTDARIALGRAGTSLPTAAHLAFTRDHAAARDAVHTPFDTDTITAGLAACQLPSIVVSSCASQRDVYLQRPDLGRQLEPADRTRLPDGPFDLALVIGDGLSALATHRHGVEVAARVHRGLTSRGFSISPVVVARGARVALSDDIGETLSARLAIILLGERPGLSSADSLGAYLTYQPARGRVDANRNCVSNIKPGGGLSYEMATHQLLYLAIEAIRIGLSGVNLKDNSSQVALLT